MDGFELPYKSIDVSVCASLCRLYSIGRMYGAICRTDTLRISTIIFIDPDDGFLLFIYRMKTNSINLKKKKKK